MLKRLTRSPIVLALSVAVTLACAQKSADAQATAPTTGQLASGLTVTRLTGPDRSEVHDGSGWLATFTDGARTVALRGTMRTLAEQGDPAQVQSDVSVRLLPAPFTGTIDEAWLQAATADATPDVFATALEYVTGGPSDADYGPALPGGGRKEGSDFNDYLGVDFTYADGTVDRAEADQRNSLDCSGFVRMVFGHRLGHPMAPAEAQDGVSLPRRAVQILDGAPGVVVIANPGTQVVAMDALQPGDLVFFDADAGDGPAIDHVGIYVGRDVAGHARFVSSRKGVNGPTLGDANGASILDGNGLYARAFRAARRL